MKYFFEHQQYDISNSLQLIELVEIHQNYKYFALVLIEDQNFQAQIEMRHNQAYLKFDLHVQKDINSYLIQ